MEQEQVKAPEKSNKPQSTSIVVEHIYGSEDLIQLFARYTVDKFVENRGKKSLDKSQIIG